MKFTFDISKTNAQKEAGESSLASGVGMWCVGVLRYRETSRNKSRNIQDESRNIEIG